MNFRTSGTGAGQGRGAAGRCQAPAFQMGKVGGQRSQGSLAHALAGKVAQCVDVLISQNPGKLLHAVWAGKRRQNGRQCVEAFDFLADIVNRGITLSAKKRGEGAFWHRLAALPGQGQSRTFTMRSLKNITIDKRKLSI